MADGCACEDEQQNDAEENSLTLRCRYSQAHILPSPEEEEDADQSENDAEKRDSSRCRVEENEKRRQEVFSAPCMKLPRFESQIERNADEDQTASSEEKERESRADIPDLPRLC